MYTMNSKAKKKYPRLVYEMKNVTSSNHVASKDSENMNRLTDGIAGVIENVRNKIDILNKEIKADEKGKQEYDDQLFRLRERKNDLEAKLTENRKWIDLFESKIKPLEGKYDESNANMSNLYDAAKLRHAQGIKVLIEQFDYHPQFKRYSDTFSAVPFRPH